MVSALQNFFTNASEDDDIKNNHRVWESLVFLFISSTRAILFTVFVMLVYIEV
jgi:hypothetical protein